MTIRTVPNFDESQSLDALRAQQRTKEFQIKKLIEISHFVNDITPEMLRMAQHVKEAEEAVRNTQNNLRIAKNGLAALIR